MLDAIYRLFNNHKTLVVTLSCSIIFIVSMIVNMPSWIMDDIIQHYSHQKLKLYNYQGTFWNGNGLLAAHNPSGNTVSPLLLVTWHITLGITQFVKIEFDAGDKRIANLYVDKAGVTLENLDMYLSITQTKQLIDMVKDLGVAGNIHITASSIHMGKILIGTINANLDNVSSSISEVNPLGSYIVQFDVSNNQISVTSNPTSILSLTGNGTIADLTLSARLNDMSKRGNMLQFLTAMGAPQADGSYQFKLF